MHYVPENQLAYDATGLGFPSIFGCQAICYQTTRGLYGFHDLKAGKQGNGGMTLLQVSDAKLGEFATWIGTKLQIGETGVALFGVINKSEQYAADASGNNDWKNVLLGLANQLTFTGDVYGGRINSHLDKNGSAYVEFNLNGGVCTAGFKRWSKMESDFANKTQPANQERVTKRATGFVAEPLFGKGEVAPVIRKDANKGFNLNQIALKSFIKFQ